MKLLDLFSGIGGFHLGLTQAGFKFDWAGFSEIDKYAKQTYSKHFPTAVDIGDVRAIRHKDLPSIDIITFGSPCQDFSIAGKRSGLGGTRSSLIGEAIRLIADLRPRFFIWENVKGTFSSNDGRDLWAIIQAFTNIGGYRLEWQLLNTRWFRPQNRERIYLVGHLGDGGGRKVFPIGEDVPVSMQRQRKISPAITSRYYKQGQPDPYIFNEKEVRIRKLTPTECERLQGFPDGWTEGQSDTQRYKQLGNAVTVPVVKAVGEKLNNCGESVTDLDNMDKLVGERGFPHK